jgi:hypothetical protein
VAGAKSCDESVLSTGCLELMAATDVYESRSYDDARAKKLCNEKGQLRHMHTVRPCHVDGHEGA